jgi:hypothetical protein
MREITGLRAVLAGLFLVSAFLVASCGEIPMRDYTTMEFAVMMVFLGLSLSATFRVDEAIIGLLFGRKKVNAN